MVDDSVRQAAQKELIRRKAAAELERRRSASAQKAQQPQQAQQQPVDAPWYMDAAQAADDVVRLAANGATFGYADKIAGYLGGDGTEAERALSDQARERAGSAGTAAELTGAIATPMGLAGKGATLAGRFGTGAMQGLGGLAARSGLMAAEGAGYGALTAMGNDQDIASGAGYGALGGAAGNVAGEALSAGVSKIAGAFNKKPAIPSIDELNVLKNKAYDAAEAAGVAYTSNGLGRLESNIVQDFTKRGFLPANEPGAAAVLAEIQKLKGQNVTLEGLDAIRKMAGNAFIPGNKSNNALTGRIVENIDDLITNPGTNDVLMGNGAAGAQAIKEARALASQTIKYSKVEEALKKAELRAASTGSGGNADNATRQNLRRILEKPRGFTADEQQALNTAVRGTGTQNALRLAGKLSPSGNGLMAALGVGGAMVNPAIGALSLGGMAAKSIADKGTQGNVQQLVDIILAGGKKSATQSAPNAVQRLSQSKREEIARILMSIGAFEAGTPAR